MRSLALFFVFTDSSPVEYQIAAQKSLQALTILNDCPHRYRCTVVDLDSGQRRSVLILHHGCDPYAHVARRAGLHSP
jgi:hypothetical protein